MRFLTLSHYETEKNAALQAFSEDSFRAEVLIFLMADLGN